MKKSLLMAFLILVFIPMSARGQSDLMQVETPNVMIIFDTSSSMGRGLDGKTVEASPDTGVDGETHYFDGAGNNPKSKLYQAKKALKEIIQDVIQDRVNLGFSTFAQFKNEYLWCKYLVPGSSVVKKRYYIYYKRRWEGWSKGKADSFVDVRKHLQQKGTPFRIGDRITVNGDFTFFQSGLTIPPNPYPVDPYQIHPASVDCEITEIVPNYEYNELLFKYKSLNEYWFYEEEIKEMGGVASCGADTRDNPFPEFYWYDHGYSPEESGEVIPLGIRMTTYFSNETPGSAKQTEYNTGRWGCQGPYSAGASDWWVRLQNPPYSFCPAVDPYYNRYPLGSTSAGPLDGSDYYYPADGLTNKPHSWSYFKTQASGQEWPDSIQANTYPSSIGASFNDQPATENNHTFFVNFPDDKDTSTPPIDRRRAAKDRILSYMDLTPVQSKRTWAYYTKLPVHADYGRTGLTENTIESIFTPLADSLKRSRDYFTDYICNYGGGDPASKETDGAGVSCRGNYVLLITDGLESARMVPGSNPPAPDYTAAPREAGDLLGLTCGGASAPVRTFVIGLGSDLKGNNTLTEIAVAGGTTKAYYAGSLDELKNSLSQIFAAIINSNYGRSKPVVSRERDRLYRAYFEITPDDEWKGHLDAWHVQSNGALDSTRLWDAGEVLKSNGRGAVYTWTASGANPERIVFTDSNSSLYPLVFSPPLNEDINGDGHKDDDDAKTIINFTLNPNYDSGRYKGKRGADWKLGDIYHSSPVLVGPPAFTFSDNAYLTFYNDNKNREKAVYVGANDGMLHGFRASNGSEIFAVIPRNLLGKLKNLRNLHDFYVDSSPKAYDVYFAAESKWKTVLISGERGGGPYYFALDITTPGDPKILWEWTDADMGDTWAKPEIGMVKIGGATKFVAFITGGYSADHPKGNCFYVVDIETGTTLKQYRNLGSNTNKIPSGATAYDADGNGFVNRVYFGDTEGALWKVDVSSPDTGEWYIVKLFTPASDLQKPVFHPPVVAKSDHGKILVFFGTGDEVSFTPATSQSSYFWEIQDDGVNGTPRWYKILNGQKVLSSPVVANYVVYFTTWAYEADKTCGAGSGKLWGFNISRAGITGGTDGLVVIDPITHLRKPKTASIDLGKGIPSTPVVTNGKIYLSSSVDADKITEVTIPGWGRTRIRSWREM